MNTKDKLEFFVLIFIWIIPNFIWEYIHEHNWALALERSSLQAVAVSVCLAYTWWKGRKLRLMMDKFIAKFSDHA